MIPLASPDLTAPERPVTGGSARRELRYRVRGIGLVVSSDIGLALEQVDATYAAFRAEPGELADGGLAYTLLDLGRGGPCRLELPDGRAIFHPTSTDGLIGLFDAMVGAIISGLHARGIYAVHAGAVVGPAGATVVAGRSGHGKTTLTLGLLRRGYGLLSDELALLDPANGLVHPYRRSVHVRPGTVALMPELAVLADRPRHELGGGSEWAVTPAEIAAALGGSVGEAAPLGRVVVLDGTPRPGAEPRFQVISPAVAALELLRGTWAASVDFGGTLGAVSGLLAGVPCSRLEVGDFERTLDLLTEPDALAGPPEAVA